MERMEMGEPERERERERERWRERRGRKERKIADILLSCLPFLPRKRERERILSPSLNSFDWSEMLQQKRIDA